MKRVPTPELLDTDSGTPGEIAASLDDLLAPQAVKRLLEPSEVAAAAAWLLGPDGRAMTGTPLVLDLGWTAR